MAFNALTDAEVERLVLLGEECAEVIKAVTKILRHGYESTDPTSRKLQPPDNRESLQLEIGDVMAIYSMMEQAGDIDRGTIEHRRCQKLKLVKKWLHHQED